LAKIWSRKRKHCSGRNRCEWSAKVHNWQIPNLYNNIQKFWQSVKSCHLKNILYVNMWAMRHTYKVFHKLDRHREKLFLKDLLSFQQVVCDFTVAGRVVLKIFRQLDLQFYITNIRVYL
jgi:hypothetical protein